MWFMKNIVRSVDTVFYVNMYTSNRQLLPLKNEAYAVVSKNCNSLPTVSKYNRSRGVDRCQNYVWTDQNITAQNLGRVVL